MDTAREPCNTSKKLDFSISGSFTPSPPSFSLPHALSSYIPQDVTLLPYNQREIIPSFQHRLLYSPASVPHPLPPSCYSGCSFMVSKTDLSNCPPESLLSLLFCSIIFGCSVTCIPSAFKYAFKTTSKIQLSFNPTHPFSYHPFLSCLHKNLQK